MHLLKKSSPILLCLFPLVSMANDCHITASPQATNVRVRALPSMNGRILRHLEAREEISGVSHDGEWLRITEASSPIRNTRGELGYVYKSLLSIQEDCGQGSAPKGGEPKAGESGSRPKAVPGHQANRELTYTLAEGYRGSGETEKALKVLNDHLAIDASDARAWKIQGDILADKEDFSGAARSYRKAANEGSGQIKVEALYLSAEMARKAGQDPESESALNEISRNADAFYGIEPQIAQARNALRAGLPLPPLKIEAQSQAASKPMNIVASLRSGYDSNVLLLPDSMNRANSGSAFLTPGLVLERAFAIGSQELRTRSQTSFTANLKQQAKPYNNLFQSLGAEWSPEMLTTESLSSSLGMRFDLSMVNSNGLKAFSWGPTAYWSASYNLSDSDTVVFELPFGYQKYPGSKPTVKEDKRDGFVLNPTALYRTRWSEITLSGGLNFLQTMAKGNNYKNHALGLLGGASSDLGWQTTGRLGAAFTRTIYQRSAQERKETRLDLSAGASRPLPIIPKLNAGLDFIYTKNNSNVGNAKYDRITTFFELSYAY